MCVRVHVSMYVCMYMYVCTSRVFSLDVIKHYGIRVVIFTHFPSNQLRVSVLPLLCIIHVHCGYTLTDTLCM